MHNERPISDNSRFCGVWGWLAVGYEQGLWGVARSILLEKRKALAYIKKGGESG